MKLVNGLIALSFVLSAGPAFAGSNNANCDKHNGTGLYAKTSHTVIPKHAIPRSGKPGSKKKEASQ